VTITVTSRVIRTPTNSFAISHLREPLSYAARWVAGDHEIRQDEESSNPLGRPDVNARIHMAQDSLNKGDEQEVIVAFLKGAHYATSVTPHSRRWVHGENLRN
jgi:hypothetical protein